MLYTFLKCWKSKRIMFHSNVCNDEIDCIDGSDEIFCPKDFSCLKNCWYNSTYDIVYNWRNQKTFNISKLQNLKFDNIKKS